jgi:hypothetical protein
MTHPSYWSPLTAIKEVKFDNNNKEELDSLKGFNIQK